MVNKFKTLLKKEKGFTLVELLAVIVILGIIVAIAIPAVGNIIDKAETDAEAAEVKLILDAARLADANQKFTSGTTTIGDLIPDYLDLRSSDLPAGLSETNTITKDPDTGAFTIDGYSPTSP